MYCDNCGKELKDGVRFCKYCGREQNSGEDQQPNHEEKAEIKQPKRKPISLVVAIPVTVILIFLVFMSFVNYLKTAAVYNGKVNINDLLSDYGLTRVFVIMPYHDLAEVNVANTARKGVQVDSDFISYGVSLDEYRYYADEFPIGYNFHGSRKKELESLKELKKIYSKTKNYCLKCELENAINWMEYDLSDKRLETITSYDKREGIVESIDFARNCEYSYNDDGLVQSIYCYTEYYDFEYSFDYDINGNMIRLTAQNFENHRGDFEYQFKYDENDKINKIIENYTQYDDKQVTDIYTWKQAYPQQNASPTIVNIEHIENGITTSIQHLKYDYYGSLLSVSSDLDPDAFNINDEFIYEYDKNGNILKERRSFTASNIVYELEYDRKGNLTCITVTDDGELDEQTKNQYDSNRLISSIYTDYNYDEESYLMKQYYPNGDIKVVEVGSDDDSYGDTKISYEYDNDHNIVEEKDYFNGKLYNSARYRYSD